MILGVRVKDVGVSGVPPHATQLEIKHKILGFRVYD